MQKRNPLQTEARRLFDAGVPLLPCDAKLKYPRGYSDWQRGGFPWETLVRHLAQGGALGELQGVDGREGIDLDVRNWGHGGDDLIARYEELVRDIAPGLLERLVVIATPSGGRHYRYRCPEAVEGNQKLATTPERNVLLETRGRGGLFMIPPSPGYRVLQGDLAALPVITPGERSALFQAARMLDQAPRQIAGDNERAGDIYNRNGGAEEALDLLLRAGWTVVRTSGGARYLRRPGKAEGVSATFGYVAPGTLYNFSSNARPFEPHTAYSPFAVLTMLQYGGDYRAAARDLARRYGLRTTPPGAGAYLPTPPAEEEGRETLLRAPSAESSFRALPAEAQIPEDAAVGACNWLEEYISFSRHWSPRSYDGFHSAVALWLLSTVAARRVSLSFGGPRYTNLSIALVARTSLHAKSTAIKIGLSVLEAAGLDFLLASDESTPQAFLRAMASRAPAGFGDLDAEKKEAARRRLGFAAQRGWVYDELGQKIAGMMRENGVMADFRGILRRLDDCPLQYTYSTIGRGDDHIERPYLALLGSLTPADLLPFAKRGATLWGDGFLARLALVAPPGDVQPSFARFPDGERVIPDSLSRPLRDWHRRLGEPDVTVRERQNTKGEPTGVYDVEITAPRGQQCMLGDGVVERFYAYHDALIRLTGESGHQDLDGNYARLAEKGLRIAMLLASLENNGRIELRHWARAQQITEGWRRDLHALYDALNADTQSAARKVEDRVLAALQRHGALTPREVGQFCHIATSEAAAILNQLVQQNELIVESGPRAVRYRMRDVIGAETANRGAGASGGGASPPPPLAPSVAQAEVLPLPSAPSSPSAPPSAPSSPSAPPSAPSSPSAPPSAPSSPSAPPSAPAAPPREVPPGGEFMDDLVHAVAARQALERLEGGLPPGWRAERCSPQGSPTRLGSHLHLVRSGAQQEPLEYTPPRSGATPEALVSLLLADLREAESPPEVP